jgi:hypothetical protein
VQFTLVVDDFGIKFVGVNHLKHLVDSLKKLYEIDLDIKGSKYCGITLEWDYVNRTVDLSMPTYVPTKLKEFNHPMPKNHNINHILPHQCFRAHKNQFKKMIRQNYRQKR